MINLSKHTSMKLTYTDEAYLASDTTGTGAVKACDWISSEEMEEMGIDENLTIYAE